ncbi:MAG: high-potential iron-sulfur protein [Pseudomonadales bacterium]
MITVPPSGPSRRKFLKLGSAGLVLIPVVNLVACAPEEPVEEPVRTPGVEPREEPLPPGEQPPLEPAVPEAPDAAPATGPEEYTILDENAPDAQALSYVHDAADVDAAAQPRYEPGQVCANCSLYEPQVTGDTGAEAVENGGLAGWGGCTIFPGRLVNAAGWCSAWVPMV